jgi:hypothetical protein
MGLPKVAVRKSIEFLPSFPRSLSLALSSCPENFWEALQSCRSCCRSAGDPDVSTILHPTNCRIFTSGWELGRPPHQSKPGKQTMPRIQDSWVTFGWWQWSLEKPGTCLPAYLF